jgi:hypothetical protein
VTEDVLAATGEETTFRKEAPDADTRTLPARHHNLAAFDEATGGCPAHARQSFRYPEPSLAQRLGSGAMELGSGVHAILLGKECLLWDRPAANGKGGKAPRNGKAWDEYRAEHPSAVILNATDYAKANRIADSIRADKDARELLFVPGIIHEGRIRWEQMGRDRQSTPDARGPSHNCELKTSRSAQPRRFVRDGLMRHYHSQMADQNAAIEYATGSRPWNTYIVCVETEPPFVVQVFEMAERVLTKGRDMALGWLAQLIECEERYRNDPWPGYGSIASFDYWTPGGE